MVSIAPEDLALLQEHFHALIHQVAGDLADGLELPRLSDLLEKPRREGWFPVPGMYGGFHYVLRGERDAPQLICASWCRVVDGSGMRHEITVDGARLVDQGFL